MKWQANHFLNNVLKGDQNMYSCVLIMANNNNDNDRPFSLLPVLSKLTEKIDLSQFNDFLTQQGNLTCHQSGNRKYHSTETLSLLVTGHIFKAMDKKEITAMVLIDLSKAFNSICHRTLLLKLQGLGV